VVEFSPCTSKTYPRLLLTRARFLATRHSPVAGNLGGKLGVGPYGLAVRLSYWFATSRSSLKLRAPFLSMTITSHPPRLHLSLIHQLNYGVPTLIHHLDLEEELEEDSEEEEAYMEIGQCGAHLAAVSLGL